MAPLLWLMTVVMGLVAYFGPRRMYWSFDAWRYRNPEANEPSDAAYGLNGCVVWVVFGFLLIASIVATAAAISPGSADPYDVASEVASEVGGRYESQWGTPHRDGLNRLAGEKSGGRVQVREVREDTETDTTWYEFTGSDGTEPACLEVQVPYELGTYGDPVSVSAYAYAGACD